MANCYNLKKVDNQWSWRVRGSKFLYYTNLSGYGLFTQKTVRETNYANECDEKQIEGTCQFSLSGYSMSGARKKINNYFANAGIMMPGL
jgi:hypothetical protein